MVLLTDGLLDLEPAVAEKVAKRRGRGGPEGDSLRRDRPGTATERRRSAISRDVAGRAGERTPRGQRGAGPLGVREIVTGRSQLVARAAGLRVTFNPKAVLEYRIIGHEANDWARLAAGRGGSRFPRRSIRQRGCSSFAWRPRRPAHCGQGRALLVSAGRRAGGRRPDDAKAVDCRGPAACSPDSANAPPWFQQAGVAAYTAEVLRHSPFIFQRNPSVKVTPAAALRRAWELAPRSITRRPGRFLSGTWST